MGKTRLACAVALAAFLAARAGADDVATEIDRHVRTIERSQDPVERIGAVRKLARLPGERIAERLGRVARRDGNAAVRVEAVAGLAASSDPAAEDELIRLGGDGGTREVRRAIARALEARKVSPERVLAEASKKGVGALARDRLVDLLATYADPMAAAHIEKLEATSAGAQRISALRALSEHPVGRAAAAGLLTDLLPTLTDEDEVLAALELAQRHGTAAIHGVARALRARKSPAINRALAEALAWIDWRLVARSASSPEEMIQPQLRFREDVVFVFHRGEQLERFRDEVRGAFSRANADRVDLRVSVFAYLEVSAMGRRRPFAHLPFTRRPERVEDFFATLTTQTRRPNGTGCSATVEEALAKSDWRWDADRAVILLADGAPRETVRLETAAAVHHAADGVRFGVVYYQTNRTDELPVPPSLLRAATAAGGTVIVVPPPPTGGDGLGK